MPITPNLLLRAQYENPEEYAYWSDDDNTNDPYLGAPYQWKVDIRIQDQNHNNYTSLMPYVFNGMDIKIGDWYAASAYGRAMYIREILDQSDPNKVVVILEDYERYNLFTDPEQGGYGLVPNDPGIIFRLNSDGLPNLGPVVQDYLGTKTIEDLMARFIARNGTRDFVLVRQDFHGFFPGDIIYADFQADTGYKKADRANLQKAVGIVTEVNVPGLAYFSYRPMGRLINNVNPPLWGAHGDVFYLDPNEPGALTNERPEGIAIPVYLQLDLPTRAIQLERGVEVTSSESETNKYNVENVTAGQRTFTLPANAKEVLYMAINGVENENYTFNKTSKVLVFDPVETGYGVDVDDEVFFFYKS